MRARILIVLSAIIMALGVTAGAAQALGTGRSAIASVGTGSQWDELGGGAYLNAWNGGPAVNVYNGNAANNDFTLISFGGNYYGLQSTNALGAGGCISDYGNSSGNARAGLVGCSINSIPWGARFTITSCRDFNGPGLEFHDVHWNGNLQNGSGGNNGDPFYLNTPSSNCFTMENPY